MRISKASRNQWAALALQQTNTAGAAAAAAIAGQRQGPVDMTGCIVWMVSKRLFKRKLHRLYRKTRFTAVFYFTNTLHGKLL